MRTDPLRIVLDFLSGLTMIGLARKYGRTKKSIEATIRRWFRKHKGVRHVN